MYPSDIPEPKCCANANLDSVSYRFDSWLRKHYLQSLEPSVELDGMYFRINEQDQIVLTRYTGNYEYLDLGDAVDVIGAYAFCSDTTLKGIKAPSVTKIGSRAFYFSSIKQAEFNSLKEVQPSVFEGSELETIDTPELEVVSYGCFFKCKHLKTVNAPMLKHIASNAFRDCSSLSYINSELIEHIGPFAFINSATKFNTNRLQYLHPLAFKDTVIPTKLPNAPIHRKIGLFLKHLWLSHKECKECVSGKMPIVLENFTELKKLQKKIIVFLIFFFVSSGLVRCAVNILLIVFLLQYYYRLVNIYPEHSIFKYLDKKKKPNT